MTARKLAGRRVLVTRSREDAGEWARRLVELGAEAVILPCIRTELFDDAGTGARLAAALRGAHWLCLMSPRGAEAVARLAAPLVPELRVAVVGASTANAVRAALSRAAFVARGGTARALGEKLLTECRAAGLSSPRIVVAAAAGGRTDAEETLQKGGAHVTRMDVYRTVPTSREQAPMDLAGEGIGDVLLASPSAVRGFLNQASISAGTRIFTLGPTTSAAAVAAGLVVSGEAAHPDLDSLVEAMQ